MSILFSRFPNFVSHFETFCNKSGTRLKKHVLRRNHSSAKILENLCDRSVLRLAGKETPDFLQGLITNDMKLLEQGSANIYSLFLNIKGRVLYDTIIYKGQDEHVYYVECDTGIIAGLERHLKMYRVRRKVDIDSMEANMKIWVAYDPKESDEKSESPESNEKKLGSIFPCASSYNKSSKRIENMMIYEDPRLSELGLRVFAESVIDRDEIARNLNFPVSSDLDPLSYREYRYKLGVGEGVADFPPGKPFPLEINCDYLHGVSFHKGCYIGQELTARTYHTGVIRKRLMPLKLESENCSELKYDEKIMDESGKAVGKFIGREGKHGLGLVRIVEGLKARKLSVGNVPVKVTKPSWWPQEVTDSAKISSSES